MVTATYFYIKCKADELCFFIVKIRENFAILFSSYLEEKHQNLVLKTKKTPV